MGHKRSFSIGLWVWDLLKPPPDVHIIPVVNRWRCKGKQTPIITNPWNKGHSMSESRFVLTKPLRAIKILYSSAKIRNTWKQYACIQHPTLMYRLRTGCRGGGGGHFENRSTLKGHNRQHTGNLKNTETTIEIELVRPTEEYGNV